MKRLIAALQFLTILPLGRPQPLAPTVMVPLFPIAGLVVGGLLAAGDLLAGGVWPRPVASAVDVVLLAIITGALHIDGLGDTADGIFSRRGRQRALEIMKDSRLGTMGLVAIIAGLGIKYAALVALTRQRFLMLLIIPALSRSSVLFGMRALPYGRPQGGTGQAFFEEPLARRNLCWVLVPAGLALLCGLRGILLLALCALTTTAVISYYRRKMACITGDMLGAMIETVETLLFLAAVAGGGS